MRAEVRFVLPRKYRSTSTYSNCAGNVMEYSTFAVSVLIAQNRALLDASVRVEQLSNVLLTLLLVEHSNKQLPVFCKQHNNNK